MKFIVAPNNVYSHECPTGNIEWDSTHLCPADKLTPLEAAQFSVFPLTETTQPIFDTITQEVVQATPALVNGVWTQQWQVNALSQAQVALNQAAAANQARLAAIDSTIVSDTVISNLQSMSNDEFDTWWGVNVTNLTQANNVLKRIARVVIRRVL